MKFILFVPQLELITLSNHNWILNRQMYMIKEQKIYKVHNIMS